MHALQMIAAGRRPAAVVVLTTLAALALGSVSGAALTQYMVSQKGREFKPGELAVRRGEAVQIVNDDADLQHHAYVESARFSFNSGDQEPGAKTNILFGVAGDFEVLCAIHPKMRLVVHVR